MGDRTVDFLPDGNDIIARALRICGAYRHDASPSSGQISRAQEALNALMKLLNITHFVRKVTDEVTHRITAPSEVDGTDSAVYTCIKSHTSTTASTPITGANYTDFWYERGDTGGTWANNTAYSAAGEFTASNATVQIAKAFYRDVNGVDYPLEITSISEFQDRSNKYETTNLPLTLYFDLGLTPYIKLWPMPNVYTGSLHYQRVREVYDFDADGDAADASKWWIQGIVYSLAADLADEYKLPIDERYYLQKKADKYLEMARPGERDLSDNNFIASCY